MIELISDNGWKSKLKNEFQQSYLNDLEAFIKKERSDFTIYPEQKDTFAALNLTPLQEVKVVIIGQDPYHGKNQAHGLSFSVNYGIKQPPSLVNIFKELRSDMGCPIANHGNLTSWAQQGVLLLNATLTVRAGQPGSHQKKGWELFTDRIIQIISEEQKNCVFMLWGNFAKTKTSLIDPDKHLILQTAHPSPLARGAFFGCGHFSKANIFLKSKNREIVKWCLNDKDLFDIE
ncbi:MAG: uracil-DNA glycosylase [Bacteroidota bacterium]